MFQNFDYILWKNINLWTHFEFFSQILRGPIDLLQVFVWDSTQKKNKVQYVQTLKI